MSYCSENNTRCDRTRFFTSMGAVTAGSVPIPIFTPGTIAGADLQIALNRIQPGYPPGTYGLLVVDGIVGPATQKVIAIVANIEAAAGGPISMTAPVLQSLADQRGLPSLPLQPMGPYAIGDKSAPPPPPRGTPGLPDSMSPTTMIVIAAVGVGVVLALVSKKKGRRR